MRRQQQRHLVTTSGVTTKLEGKRISKGERGKVEKNFPAKKPIYKFFGGKIFSATRVVSSKKSHFNRKLLTASRGSAINWFPATASLGKEAERHAVCCFPSSAANFVY